MLTQSLINKFVEPQVHQTIYFHARRGSGDVKSPPMFILFLTKTSRFQLLKLCKENIK